MKRDFPVLTQHLRDVNESYFVHMRHAFYFCRNCLKASAALSIHSAAPFLFKTTGSTIISNLHNIMTIRSQAAAIENSKDQHVAIVGFGLSGLLAFTNIVRNYEKSSGKLVIRIFDKSHSSPKGTAYSTKNINHLLNVPACRMGIIPDDREHFYNWLISKGYHYEKLDFVPRQIFGSYLEDVLDSATRSADEKGISYEFVHKEISEIGKRNSHYLIDGKVYHHCILATGIRFKNGETNFWQVDLEKYLGESEIHIIGSGLTAFDAAISLRDRNYPGKIFVHSRRGKIPQVHKFPLPAEKAEAPLTLKDADLPLSLILRKFVAACKKSPDWRLSFDAMRPLTQVFWKALNTEKKKRFLRHGFRLWNTHRHRCPESQFADVTKLVDSGRLVFTTNRTESAHTIDCTGFDYGFRSKLIDSLIANGIVKSDDLQAGIVTENPNFHILGGLNFGSTFEITAVPDITPQAHQIAQTILKSFAEELPRVPDAAIQKRKTSPANHTNFRECPAVE